MSPNAALTESALTSPTQCRIAAPSSLPHSLKDICTGCPARGKTCHHRHGPRQLYAYWMRRRRGRAWPSFPDVQGIFIGRLQPSIFLVDVGAGPDFRYWQVGAVIEAIHGQNLTGKSPDEIWAPEVAGLVKRHYAEVVRSERPRCYHPTLLDADGAYRYYTRLILPLSSNGVHVDMLLGGLFPQAMRYKKPG